MPRQEIKRETDLQIISEWVDPGSRVLDLGCGRGLLLEHLMQAKQIEAVGVDASLEKIRGCIRRGVPAYMGDLEALMEQFPDEHFDWVICSRTVHELSHPGRIIRQALRVGRRFAVGFVNAGYWRGRLAHLLSGARPLNEVYPQDWYESTPSNPVTVRGFERFCAQEGFHIRHRRYLRGDWRTPVTRLPSLRAGYAVYELERA